MIHTICLSKYGVGIYSYTVTLITSDKTRRILLIQKSMFSTKIRDHCSNDCFCFFSATEALWGKTKSERFNGKRHSYAYFCKVSKELAENGHLQLEKEGSFNVYHITKKGESLYQWYQLNFKERLCEVKMFIDRFVYDLTGSGENPPVEHELPDEHRKYFAKLVSVMDLVRYVTLKAAMIRGHVHMAGIEDLLKQKYGWVTSSGYHYELAKDMERSGLLVGQW